MGFAPGVVAGSLVAYVPARGLAALPMNRLSKGVGRMERKRTVNPWPTGEMVRFHRLPR